MTRYVLKIFLSYLRTLRYQGSLKNKNITGSCNRLLWPGCVDTAEANTETQNTELRHFQHCLFPLLFSLGDLFMMSYHRFQCCSYCSLLSDLETKYLILLLHFLFIILICTFIQSIVLNLRCIQNLQMIYLKCYNRVLFEIVVRYVCMSLVQTTWLCIIKCIIVLNYLNQHKMRFFTLQISKLFVFYEKQKFRVVTVGSLCDVMEGQDVGPT